MTWQLIGREYVRLPYKITPGIQGYSVWIAGETDLTRIGRDIKSLASAKALAVLHAKGDKRVPA
jgi:hypothetical protein